MKALLINPHKLIPTSFSLTQRASPPLGLAYIAAAVEDSGYAIKVYDCVAENPNKYFSFQNFEGISALGEDFETMFASFTDSFDLICVSVMFSNNWLINRHLINELRAKFPESVIVIGGEHASAIPEYCLNDCEGLDLVVMGEGEETIADIATKLKDGKPLNNITGTAYKDRNNSNQIILNERRKRIREINDVVRPAWQHFPLKKYFENEISYGIAYGNSLPIFATRGCPYECTFCSSPQMWGLRYNMRDVTNVIDEIKWLKNDYAVTNIDFYDLTAIINKRWILDFCKKVIDENLNITFQIPAGTRAEAIDYEVAIALKSAGCKNITYAPESGSEGVLKSIKKKVIIDNMMHSIDESYKANLNIKLNIMLGYPDEKIGDVLKTVWFLVKASYHGATDASPSVFSPYPGSALFTELETNKELTLSDDYFKSIVFSQSLHHFINYNRNYSKATLIFLLFLSYMAFYASNYLFRPLRMFRLFINVYTKKYETRGEYMLGEVLKRRQAIKT